jgi:hypothetical protein
MSANILVRRETLPEMGYGSRLFKSTRACGVAEEGKASSFLRVYLHLLKLVMDSGQESERERVGGGQGRTRSGLFCVLQAG